MRYDKELYAKHLQGMVRFPTVSNADPERSTGETFLGSTEYLEETYPWYTRP